MKITKYFDQKENKEKFRARFQLHNKEFRPVADTRKALKEMIDEIRAQEHRAKHSLPVITVIVFPTVQELFDKYEARITVKKAKTMFKRVSARFLKLIPEGLKVNELKKAHFQLYADERLKDINKKNNEKILPGTVNKEFYSLGNAFNEAPKIYEELNDMEPIKIEKLEETNRRRERLVSTENELPLLLDYLRKPQRTKTTTNHRRKLADDLEIRYETGLRRKEVARLKKTQYHAHEAALRDVKRWKTDTITKFFPLTARAVEIIEARIAENTPSEYIFTNTGNPNESVYRTLREVCATLEINYGAYKDGGFVPHDLRHNFATEIIKVTDIETAKSLTGHTGNHIMTYLHTNENLQRDAMRKREGIELKVELFDLYYEVKGDKIGVDKFIEKVRFLTGK